MLPALFLPPIGALGGPIVFGVSLVATLLSSLFGGLFGGGDTKKLADAVNKLAGDTAKAIDLATRFSWKVAFTLGSLLGAIHDLWVDFWSQIWDALKKVAGYVKKIATDVLPAIAKAVRNARELLNRIYRDFIRPIMNTIQKIRRYLAILRALHVPFADKLDRILTRVQAKIIGPYLYALRTLNGIGSWVNVILTAGGVIQRAVFVNSMYAYQRDWVNMWWVGQSGGGAVSANAPTPARPLPPTAGQVKADFDVYARTGAGPFVPVIAQANTYFDKGLAAQ